MANNDNGFSGSMRPLLKGLGMLLSLGLVVWLFRYAGLDHVLQTGWFDEQIRGRGMQGILLYVAVTALGSAIGMPRQIFCFFGGYAFGVLWGVPLASLGCSMGCLLAMCYARFFGREFLCRHFGKRVAKVDAFLEKRPFAMAVTIRFFPIGSNLVANLAAGVSSIPMLPFLLGSTLGYLPVTVVFVLFGSGVDVSSTARMVLSVVLFVVSSALGVSMYRRHRAEVRAARESAGTIGTGGDSC